MSLKIIYFIKYKMNKKVVKASPQFHPRTPHVLHFCLFILTRYSSNSKLSALQRYSKHHIARIELHLRTVSTTGN